MTFPLIIGSQQVNIKNLLGDFNSIDFILELKYNSPSSDEKKGTALPWDCCTGVLIIVSSVWIIDTLRAPLLEYVLLQCELAGRMNRHFYLRNKNNCNLGNAYY